MSDRAVKLFMTENNIPDFEIAQNIMFKYGLADEYEAKVQDEPDLSENDEVMFAEGAAFIASVVDKIKFAVEASEEEIGDTERAFLKGVDTATTAIKDVVALAMKAVNDEAPEPEVEPLGMEAAQLFDMYRAIFGEPPKG